MQKIDSLLKTIISPILAIMFTVSTLATSMAAPIHVPAPQVIAESEIETLKVHKRIGRKGIRKKRRYHRYGRYHRHGKYRRHNRYHRHGRHYRRGRNVLPYIIGGIIIGGIIFHSREQYRNHVRWCEKRYRSYNSRSDTFQPYHGSRRRCVSPYR